MQILRHTPASLELLVYQAGTLTDLDETPTVTVTDANGDAVAGIGSVSHPDVGVYRATLPGQSDLNLETAVWAGELGGNAVQFTRRYEIVGNLLFLEAEARAKTITGQQTPLSDENDYPDTDIARIRALITDQFEHRTGRAWTRRYARCELAGTGTHEINLSRGHHRTAGGTQAGGPGRLRHIARIISASLNGTAVDAADLVIDGRRVLHTAGVWARGSTADPFNVVIEYEYGPDPVPLEANENGLHMALDNLIPSDISGHAQTFASPDGTITFEGGLNYPTRVWEWLKNHRPVLLG